MVPLFLEIKVSAFEEKKKKKKRKKTESIESVMALKTATTHELIFNY